MTNHKTQVFSYGGGQQSVAIAVLIAQGKLPKPDHIVIADTGREASSTWEYLERYVRPMLKPLGLEVEIAPHDLATVDLFSGNGDVLMPMYTDQSGQKGKLASYCSNEWKKRVTSRYLRAQGVKECDNWIGFSLDEIERVKPSGLKWLHQVYPLLDGLLEDHVPWGLGSRFAMSRGDCVALIRDAGLPLPAKSSCWMCPHRGNSQWRDLRDNHPDDFQAAIDLEAELRERDPHVFLHKDCVPLEMADLSKDSELDSNCSLGLCWV